MTYQPTPAAEPSWPPVTPTPRRSRKPLIIAGTVAVLLVAALAVAILVIGLPGGGVSKSTAARVCRTAVGSEWQQRVNGAGTGLSTTIVPSVQEIEMMETWEVDGGYAVNATVHYTLTTGFVDPVEGTIDLTCTATGSDDAPETTVTNRS